MRISDWSSDVCSSDLGHSPAARSGVRLWLLSPVRVLHHPAMSSVADLARANARSRQSGLRNFIEPIAEDYTASLRGMGLGRMQMTLCKKVFSASRECRQRALKRWSRATERREGKECARTWRYRWAPAN